MAHALLVEDDVFSSVILQEILLAAGHSVRIVYDGQAALRLIETAQVFDIAVVDVLLPQQVGLDVVRALRRKSASIGIIAIGGAGASQDVVLSSGANVALPKPISRSDLSNHVAALLKSA